METLNIKQLRSAVIKYTKPSTKQGTILFSVDFSIYLMAVSGTIFLDDISLKILCSIVAGLKIASLFAIAHDAAHDSFTSNKLLNKIIARISFLPVLHNYSLWLIAHNRSHHQAPNVKGLNSWSPLSLDEYSVLSSFRKTIERFYRHPSGLWLNYLIERWLKHKFIPYKSIVGDHKAVYWLDVLLILSYVTLFLCTINYAANSITNIGMFSLFMLSFVMPIVIGSYLISFTVYVQHTHESIAWFTTKKLSDEAGYDQEDLSMYMKFPAWYNIVSHNAMEHTVHHIDPRVPTYNLAKAQKIIIEHLGINLVTSSFSISNFIHTMEVCKLYDYEQNCWLDFDGNTTSQINLIDKNIDYAIAA